MKKIFTGTCLFLFMIITIVSCTESEASLGDEAKPAEVETETPATNASRIERGAYLVEVAGCHDCHSTKIMGPMGPQPDPEKLLGGHISGPATEKVDPALIQKYALFNHATTMAIGPWGASYAANLSSDESGIGSWSEEQFINAIRKGKFKGLENGRPLLPPMPWPNIAKMTDEDLKSIFAYLKTTKPVNNVVPPPTPLEELVKK